MLTSLHSQRFAAEIAGSVLGVVGEDDEGVVSPGIEFFYHLFRFLHSRDQRLVQRVRISEVQLVRACTCNEFIKIYDISLLFIKHFVYIFKLSEA